MQRIRRDSKRVTILVVVTAASIVLVSSTLFFYFEYQIEEDAKREVFQRQVERQSDTTHRVSLAIASDLDRVASRLQTIALSDVIQGSDDRAKMVLLDELNSQLPRIDALYMTDQRGVIQLASTLNETNNRLYVGRDVGNRTFIQDAVETRSVVFSDLFLSFDGVYRIAVVYPLFSHLNGEYEGSVVALASSSSFFGIYATQQQPSSVNDRLTILGADANIVYTDLYGTSSIGKNYWSNSFQTTIDPVLSEMTESLLSFQSNSSNNDNSMPPSYAIYNYGGEELLTTQSPILILDRPVYFLQISSGTQDIYRELNGILFDQRGRITSLLIAAYVAIGILILVLIKWAKIAKEAEVHAEELEKSNRMLAEANRKLAQAESLQKDFVNIAAHELRTPIQPILMNIDALQRKLSSSTPSDMISGQQQQLPSSAAKASEEMSFQHELSAIMRNAKKLEILTNDILDVSRIDTRSLKLHKERFDLVAVTESVIEDFRNQLSKQLGKQNMSLIFANKSGNAEIEITADRARVIQVLSNLIGNAIKFTPDYGTASVSVKKDKDYALVSVSDTGKGISENIMPKLFSKFATDSDHGTGLGLFISKNIVEAHGGKIWAENNSDGKGATFSFALPISK